MKYILLIFSIVFTNTVFSQQIVVKDSLSQEPIPFVAITFGDNDGFYSNSDGLFNLEDVKGDSLSLYSLGYKLKKIAKKDIAKTIFLNQDRFELKEVVITNKPLKYKSIKSKPKKHNDFLQSHRLIVGEELALFIPNNYKSSNGLELNNIIIPIVTKTISFDKELEGKVQKVKKLPFSSLYKISFYTNKEGLPDKKLDYDDITVVLNEASNTVKLDLSKFSIILPDEGFFVGILNLGKTDDNGSLISETPFEIKETKRGMVKIAKPTKPYFPVYYSEKTNLTFLRNTFNKEKEWNIFYKHSDVKSNEFHNISLGFELKMF